MKKVLVLAIALGLFAAPVMAATIEGSAHDLSSSGTSNPQGDLDRICAYCHTPHSSSTDADLKAPLWNGSRMFDETAIGSAGRYNSATLTSFSKPSAASLTGTDAPICLGCHDGTIGGNLVNPVAGFAGGRTITSSGSFTSGLINEAGTQLSNDHPIGMNFSKASVEDAGGLNTIGDAIGSGVRFYGTNSQIMWCSSCHNVHDPGTDVAGKAPFLKMSNAKSALCLACHNK